LFQVVREERGLAYSIYSFLTSYADSGMLGVCTAVAPRDLATSVDLILKEIRRLRREPVPVDVLGDAKEYTKGNLLMSAESPDNQMARLAQNEFSFGRSIPMQSVIDNIDAVTPADLLALAEELWNGGKAAMTMVGPGVDGTDFSEQLAL
jgi:predicted Zn-dependent peptidase